MSEYLIEVEAVAALSRGAPAPQRWTRPGAHPPAPAGNRRQVGGRRCTVVILIGGQRGRVRALRAHRPSAAGLACRVSAARQLVCPAGWAAPAPSPRDPRLARPSPPINFPHPPSPPPPL